MSEGVRGRRSRRKILSRDSDAGVETLGLSG